VSHYSILHLSEVGM